LLAAECGRLKTDFGGNHETDNCALAVAIACTGCASIVNDSTHPMKVETKTQADEIAIK